MQMIRKGKKQGGGAGGVSLPEDIVFDVLARVPAKALCRFRCVCKAWRALLSDPAFVAVQSSRAGPHLIGVFYKDRWPRKVQVMDMEGNVIRDFKVQVQALRKRDSTKVMGLLQLVATTKLDLICTNHATIIDPAAGRACTISSNTPLAIGRAAQSGVLKVIDLHYVFPSMSQICKVATIVDGTAKPLTWRQGSGPPFVTTWKMWNDSKQRATVNGVVYLRAWNSGTNRIAAFDLETEDWKIINGPTFGIKVRPWRVTLTELKGTLGVVQYLRKDDRYSCVNIWLLIDFSKSVWVKEYNIQVPKTWKLTQPLGALHDGRILLLVKEIENVKVNDRWVGCHHRKFLVFYNPGTETITKFMDTASDTSLLYTGSLLS